MKATDESFDILGFTKEEKDSVYRITAGIMHSGNMLYTQKPREEQAENGNVELSEKAGFMLGISGAEYAKALCSPRVKVGSEYVVKGQTVEQVYYALGAICKAVFEKLFNWLVAVVNRALSTELPKSFFIGILGESSILRWRRIQTYAFRYRWFRNFRLQYLRTTLYQLH